MSVEVGKVFSFFLLKKPDPLEAAVALLIKYLMGSTNCSNDISIIIIIIQVVEFAFDALQYKR